MSLGKGVRTFQYSNQGARVITQVSLVNCKTMHQALVNANAICKLSDQTIRAGRASKPHTEYDANLSSSANRDFRMFSREVCSNHLN